MPPRGPHRVSMSDLINRHKESRVCLNLMDALLSLLVVPIYLRGPNLQPQCAGPLHCTPLKSVHVRLYFHLLHLSLLGRWLRAPLRRPLPPPPPIRPPHLPRHHLRGLPEASTVPSGRHLNHHFDAVLMPVPPPSVSTTASSALFKTKASQTDRSSHALYLIDTSLSCKSRLPTCCPGVMCSCGWSSSPDAPATTVTSSVQRLFQRGSEGATTSTRAPTPLASPPFSSASHSTQAYTYEERNKGE